MKPIKERVYELVKEGQYKGLSDAARQLQCSSQSVWYALRALEAEEKIVSQLPFKINQ